ncbi:MAG: GTP-binding protein [Pelagibacterales bacterium]|nr:GTP-binding protein [Pelagibacterales bacterium]
MKKQTFIDSDESNTNEINFIIVGKPNSGKSTLFNNLLKEDISPTGDEYGLTKTLFTNSFEFNDIKFVIHDTPGLRRKNKIYDKDETSRNQKVLKLINKIDATLLLIDATENFTKQDFRIADLALDRKKILFIIFNKFDLIEDKKEFRNEIENFRNKL